jgi:hypothetical protein
VGTARLDASRPPQDDPGETEENPRDQLRSTRALLACLRPMRCRLDDG